MSAATFERVMQAEPTSEVSILKMVRHAIRQSRGWCSLRYVYNRVASMIPQDRALLVYHRQRQESADDFVDDDVLQHRVGVGRKRSIYRAMLQLAQVGYLEFGDGADWNRKVRLTNSGELLTAAEIAGSRRRRIGKIIKLPKQDS